VLKRLGLSESQQLDFIERIDIPERPPNNLHILEEDPCILLRNIDTRLGLRKAGVAVPEKSETERSFFSSRMRIQEP
jgi:hypothetical protein